MPSNKELVLLGGIGIVGFILLRNSGGVSAFGGSGGTGGFGGFTGGPGGIDGTVDGLESSQESAGSQGTPLDIFLGVREPDYVPAPIPPSNTIPSDIYTPAAAPTSGRTITGVLTTPGHNAISQFRTTPRASRARQALNSRTSSIPGSRNEGRGISSPLRVRAQSPVARSILTNPENQAPSIGAYQRFTPIALREVYGININPFSARDPVDGGQNRYPDAPAFVSPTDSAVRAATGPELQARGININPYSERDPVDNGDNQNYEANNLIARAHEQAVSRPTSPTISTGEPGNRRADRESSEADLGIFTPQRPTAPPAPTPTETTDELRRRGIGINPFGRSGN